MPANHKFNKTLIIMLHFRGGWLSCFGTPGDKYCDIVEHFGRYCFFYLAIFVSFAGGAMLEEVIERWVDFRLGIRSGIFQGFEIFGGIDLGVALTTYRKDRACRFSNVVERP